MGAEHRNPRLLPRSIAGGGSVTGRKTGVDRRKKCPPTSLGSFS